jgi:hypothetical protein
MRAATSPSSPGRATIAMVCSVASLILGLSVSVMAQEPPPPPAAEAQQPPAEAASESSSNPFMFDSDAGMLTFFIKAGKAADFERVMARLHAALAESDEPQRRQMAEGWRLYKAAEPGPNNTVLYVNFISPVLKGGDYTVSKILAEAFPQEVQELFVLYRDAFAGLSRAELSLVNDFGGPPPSAAPATSPTGEGAETPPDDDAPQP